MGMPAAKLTSTTAHGGMVTGGTPRVLISGLPAARLTDTHVCPLFNVLVPHTGGIILGGSVVVLTGGLPQARMTDSCVCGAPNMVALGDLFVLVGESSDFDSELGAATMAGFLTQQATAEEGETGPYPSTAQDKDGNILTTYAPGVTIGGPVELQANTVATLDSIASTAAGRENLARIQDSGRTVTILQSPDGNSTISYADPSARSAGEDGNGAGTDSTISFAPQDRGPGPAGGEGESRPPEVGLAGMLAYAASAAEGSQQTGTQMIGGQETSNRAAVAIGIGTSSEAPGSENAYRAERGLPARTGF
jgi:uncharacterized Zn-binding protein involved in type VI secretion